MEINNINPIESQSEINLEIKPQENTSKKLKTFPVVLVFGIIIGVILTASIASAVYFYQIAKTKSSDSDKIADTETPTINNSQTTQFGTITWLAKPQKISPLIVLSNTIDSEPQTPAAIYFSKINYYLVANFSNGSQLIDMLIPQQEGSNTNLVYQLVKSSNGELSIINSTSINQVEDRLLSSIKIIDLDITDLNPPETIVVGKNSYTKSSYFRGQLFESLSSPKSISSTDFGDFYTVYTQTDNSELYAQNFYLKLKNWIVLDYNPSSYDFMNDDNTTKIQWTDGVKNTNQFMSVISSGGCGGSVGGRVIIKNNSSVLSDKVAIGTYNQKTIYQLKNTSNPIVQKLYKDYKDSHSYDNNVLSSDSFTNNIKNHFIYQDSTEDWVLFINQSYTLQAECGKPVIYLYPTKETQVSVKVDAKITKSEPEYPTDGWIVIAKPNGDLNYQNKIYPNLFWEGLGNGIYPNYKDRGIVVSQKDLISTLNSQLKQLGLNSKESIDFMDFWQSKLPTTPFVRLTWLGTKDMDILAPLTVDPKPDTKIRIFLEFEGLQNPIKLIPQNLSAPVRHGFTLIEWGGLLLK